jgi:hypothetical protein
MQFDPERVRDNAAGATTDDLLDRVTVYRSGLEPAALDLIEAELLRRGFGPREIEAYAASHSAALYDSRGLALKCARCQRPAVWQGWTMHRLWGVLPLFPRRMALCAEHQPRT